jgi:hypothetical protein
MGLPFFKSRGRVANSSWAFVSRRKREQGQDEAQDTESVGARAVSQQIVVSQRHRRQCS